MFILRSVIGSRHAADVSNLHYSTISSSRMSTPAARSSFVAVNRKAFTDGMVESELFGSAVAGAVCRTADYAHPGVEPTSSRRNRSPAEARFEAAAGYC